MNKCLNIAMTKCFWCGEENGIAIGEKLVNCKDKWKTKNVFGGYEPCNKCKENFDKGFTIIEAQKTPLVDGQPEIQKGIYPTGYFTVVKMDAAIGAFGKEIANNKKAFMSTKMYEEFGLKD